MIEKALIAAIFMYCVSGGVFAAQYVIGDVYDIQITNVDGVPVSSSLISVIQTGSLNNVAASIQAGDFTANTTNYDRVETFVTAGAFVAWELVLLLSGTYIFNVMFLLGVPLPVVAIFGIIYMILFARMVIGYIRGV